MQQSVLDWLGLPANFGYALLIIGLVLTLAPYLRGSDFGVIKIPDFDPPVRRTMRVVGPTVMLGAVLMHVEILSTAETVGEGRPADGNPQELQPLTPDPGAPVELKSGSAVLAPQGNGRCLYAAKVVAVNEGIVDLRFSFGRDGDARAAHVLPTPLSPAGEVALGERVYARLDQSDVWAPAVVKEVRDGRALADLEPETDCAGKYARPYVWAELTKTTLIARED